MQLKSIATGLLLAGSSLLSAVSASPAASSRGEIVRNDHANKQGGKIAPKVFIISMVGGSPIDTYYLRRTFWPCLSDLFDCGAAIWDGMALLASQSIQSSITQCVSFC